MVHFKGHKLPHDFHPLSLEGWSVLAGHAWRLKMCSHAIIQYPEPTSMLSSILNIFVFWWDLREIELIFIAARYYLVCVNDVCPQAQPPWLWSKSKNSCWATSQPRKDIEYKWMTVPEMHLLYLRELHNVAPLQYNKLAAATVAIT